GRGSNQVTSTGGTVSGGQLNLAGFYATVPGGIGNEASGAYSFAAGLHARANASRCVAFSLWNSILPGCIASASTDFSSSARRRDSPSITTRGDPMAAVRDSSASAASRSDDRTWTGAFLTDGGVWTNASDANATHAFEDIDKAAILDKVSALPVRYGDIKLKKRMFAASVRRRRIVAPRSDSAPLTERSRPSTPTVLRSPRSRGCISCCGKEKRASPSRKDGSPSSSGRSTI
ncbi:MAG TPA: hypothetical protein VNE58_02555, partial [Casimicrobiaceae bacterium]|nr:hypothetical protein [Casimicrobiaceae bacterium]